MEWFARYSAHDSQAMPRVPSCVAVLGKPANPARCRAARRLLAGEGFERIDEDGVNGLGPYRQLDPQTKSVRLQLVTPCLLVGQLLFEFDLAGGRQIVENLAIHKQLRVGFRHCHTLSNRSRWLAKNTAPVGNTCLQINVYRIQLA